MHSSYVTLNSSKYSAMHTFLSKIIFITYNKLDLYRNTYAKKHKKSLKRSRKTNRLNTIDI
ncbi:MAG: hypothetical protein CMC70_10150 [Flavobacteriaceae bacterium]|nr:hypothetical protein [Flavobacteriaceae bacterium]